MAIQGNRYNDPALGAAFGNIASLFAPPSAQDLVGYASAKAKKQEAEQMAWLFANPTDPTAAARSALTGVQSFGNTPEGFGMTDATNRFGITTDANTKLSMNAADNARALATNGADNQRATITSLFGPLNEGQVRPAVPAEIAATQGLPSIASAFGTPKPLSVDQLNAQTLQGMTPQAREAVAFGNTPLETILQGDNPVFSTRPGAIGQTPVPEAADAPTSVQEFQYAQANGFVGTYNDWVTQKARAGATRVQIGADKAATAAANAQSTGTDVIANAANRALEADKERQLGGLAGYAASFVPGSANAEAYRQVDVLKSNATIEALQAMRAASPTGGALGSVTEKENTMLAAKLGALDPASPNFARDLRDYTLTLLRTVHGYQAGTIAFEEEFGELLPGQKSRTPAAPPAAPGAAPPVAPAPTDPSVVLQEARDAITSGADPEAVRARLLEMGLDPEDL